MSIERIAIAVGVILAVLIAVRVGSYLLKRRHIGDRIAASGIPTILYFTTEDCAQCRAYQQPALEALQKIVGNLMVRKLDAVREKAMASRFNVMTVPSTVVVSADGTVQAVNYGLATTETLRRQLVSA